MENPGPFDRPGLEASGDRGRLVCDFIAGMTDRYVLKLYDDLFIPRPWDKL
jgi:dGTPase